MRRRVLALVAGVGVVAIAGGLAWDARGDHGASVPAVVADAIDQRVPEGSGFDKSTAALVSQDETTRVWKDAQGVNRAESSLVPVRVQRDGAWIPASNVVTEKGGFVIAANHPLAPEFPAVLGDKPIVSVDAGGHSIALTLEGQRRGVTADVSSGATAEGDSTVTYANAVQGADAVYDVVPGSVKESFVVHNAPRDALTFAWVIDAPGLNLVRNDFGGVDFVAPDGKVVANVPPPAMWDSAGAPDALGSDLVNVPFEFESLGEGRFRFTLSPDQQWLSAKERQYPVYVDPSVTYGADDVGAVKFDGTIYGGIRIGNPAQRSGWTAWRSVAHYPYENLFGYRITSATLKSTVTSGTANCYDGGLWTATAFSYAGIGDELSPFPNCATGDADSDTLSNYFASLVANRASGAYLMLAGDEGYAYSYKQLSTTMTFTYVNAAITTGVTGVSPRKTVATDPLLQVYVDDVVITPVGAYYAGTAQLFRYTFTPTAGTAWVSPWVQSGPYRVPDTALIPGKDYTYKIETQDNYGYVSPVTTKTDPLWTFHTRSAPNTPTNVTVNGQALTGTVVSAVVRPVIAATVSDPDGATGGDVWALFTVKQDGIVVMDSVPGSKVQGSGVSSVMLPYAISAGVAYKVEVRAFDGHLAGDALAPPDIFKGPAKTLRELPTTGDAATGAAS